MASGPADRSSSRICATRCSTATRSDDRSCDASCDTERPTVIASVARSVAGTGWPFEPESVRSAATRAAASASRAAGSSPDATAATTASTHASTSASSLSGPRQHRSAPAASAATTEAGMAAGPPAPPMSSASVTTSAGEPELVAQQVGHDAGAGRGGTVGVERRHEEVAGHHGLHADVDGGPERHELAPAQHLGRGGDRGQRVVRVDGRLAVPREVLDAGGHPRRLQPGDERGRVHGHEIGVGAERAHADDRVRRVAVGVGARRQVEIDPGRPQQRRRAPGRRRG